MVEAQLKDQQLETHRQTKSHLAWAGPHKASAAALRGPLYGAEEAEEQVAQGGRWLDPLLSQLAAVAALLMEHVVTPPSAPLLASPYAERVATSTSCATTTPSPPTTPWGWSWRPCSGSC